MLRRTSSSFTLSSLPTAMKVGSYEHLSTPICNASYYESAKLMDSTRFEVITCESTMTQSVAATATFHSDSDESQLTPLSFFAPLDGLETYKSTKKMVSGGCTSSMTTLEDGWEGLTESQRIAYSYRYSEKTQDLMNDTVISSRLIDGASCSHTQATMWYATAGTEDVFQNCRQEETAQAAKSLQLCDMLCSISPRIIEGSPEDLEKLRTIDLLKKHRRVPHTIVIDSHVPELTPHIVISSPEETTWEAFYLADGNRVGSQTRTDLIVPPLYGHTGRMHTYWELMSTYYPPEPSSLPVSQQSESRSLSPGVPLVFNHRTFLQSVETMQQENTVCAIIPAILRHLFRATTVIASLQAREFRRRYDVSGFFDHLEKPFEWADPAEPLISIFNKGAPSAVVLYSDIPFSVPHIVIQEAPSNDPWIVYANSTDVQDSAFGESLVVTGARHTQMHYVNLPGDEDECSDDSMEVEGDNMTYLSDTSSCDSSCLATPSGLQRLDSGFFTDLAVEEDIAETSYATYEVPNSFSYVDPSELTRSLYTSCVSDTQQKFFIDEDEEDGPPEWDDWFVSASERARRLEESTIISPICS